MRKIKMLLALALSAVTLTACNSNTTSDSQSNGSSNSTDVVYSSEKSSTSTTDSSVVTQSTPPKGTPNFMGNRTVQYTEAQKSHQAFWSFAETQDGEYISADALIMIKIVNENGETVYDQTHQVDESFYATYTNPYWDKPRYLGCINISQSDITKGTISKGVLYISASTPDGEFWEPYEVSITNLPLMDFNMTLPSMPVTISNFTYSGKLERKIEVQNIDYTYEDNYNGTVTLELNIKAKMTYNNSGNTHSDISKIGYKIKDSEGFVVDSGTILLDPMCVGDMIKEEKSVYSLKLGETYTLELIDAD
ncbi:MAG: hypothetical protein ACI4JT_04905 [Oscillospiraceae bacterium]